ncbi:MAG: hypothetical protein ACTTHI_05250 [Prevotella sp.]
MFSKIFRSEQENKDEENNSLCYTTEELVERIEALETKVASLEGLLADYDELKSTIAQLQKAQEKPANSALNSEHTIAKAPQKVGKLYLDAPFQDGSFSTFSSEEHVGKSLYVLETQDNKMGTFRVLDSNDALATLLISTSRFVKPVCKLVDLKVRMPQRIVTVEEGQAIFVDGVWKTTQKAVVRLE